MPTRSKGAKMHRKEEEAMALATLAREKEAAKRQLQEEEAAAPVASGVALPLVVSPPSALNLNSLLTGSIRKVREPKMMESPQKPWKRTWPTTLVNHPRRRNQRNLKKKTMRTSVIDMVWPSRRVVSPQLPQPSQPPLQTNTSMNKYSMKQD
jgi:hypothetical protein